MRGRPALLLGVFVSLAAPATVWAKTEPFTGKVVGSTFEATYDVAAAGKKVCVKARKVRDRSAGVGELRLKIVGFPAKVFTDPDPGGETCLADRDFADAVRDTKSIEARVYDVQDKPLANGRLKQPKDNGRHRRHPRVEPLR